MTDREGLAPFGVVADGVYVQETVSEGIDLLVSAHEDEVFGPILTIGAGGIATELERDVAHLALPFSDRELIHALRPLRIWPRLAGFRGMPGCDLDVVVRTARAIADLLLAEAKSLSEIELNPLRIVVSDTTDCVALDAVILRRTR